MKYNVSDLLNGSRLVDADLQQEWLNDVEEVKAKIRELDQQALTDFINLRAEIEGLPAHWSPTNKELELLVSGKGKGQWQYEKLVDRLNWLAAHRPQTSELTIFLETLDTPTISDNDIKVSGVETRYGLGKYVVRAAREER